MKPTRFALLALVTGVPVAFFAARGADAQQVPAAPSTRMLSIATLAPAGSTWARGLDAWNRELRRRTNKTLALRIFAGGVQGDEAEVIRKIRAGRLDGAAVTAVGLAQVHRPALVFQMPGMFASYAQLDTARNAMTADMQHAFDTAGFIHMGWADVGMTYPFTRVPVRTPADMRSLHPWVWRDDAVLPAFFEAANVTAVALQVPEVLTALQTNRIDSFISSPVAAVSLQWASRVSHMTLINSTVAIGATIIGKNQFNSLTPEQQTILRETATQFHGLLITNLRRDEATALAGFPTRGITIVQLTPAERASWTGLFDRTRERLVGRVADAAFIARVRGLAH